MRGVIPIPPDGRWHRVPSRHASAANLRDIMLDVGDDGRVVALNTGERPIDVYYEEEDEA